MSAIKAIKRPPHFNSFNEFFPFYLSEHSNPINRGLHFIGSTLVLIALAYAFLQRAWSLLALLPVIGYFFAWIGHFFIEKNRPATFTYPLWSLAGDFKMWKRTLTGEIKDDLKIARSLYGKA